MTAAEAQPKKESSHVTLPGQIGGQGLFVALWDYDVGQSRRPRCHTNEKKTWYSVAVELDWKV